MGALLYHPPEGLRTMQKFIVARFPNAGIGDHLSSVLGCWRYAKQTGRTLVVDWRGSRFNTDHSTNAFFRFFQQTDSIAGVPVIADDDLSEIYTETADFYWSKWS